MSLWGEYIYSAMLSLLNYRKNTETQSLKVEFVGGKKPTSFF